MSAQRDQFASRLGFILASAGSAIGLGNIWRFPFVAGENGGAAFVCIYLALVLAVGLPVMLAEFIIGRHTQQSAVGALRKLGGPVFIPLGAMGVVAAVIILSFYGVVGGFTIRYTFVALFGGVNLEAAAAGKVFETFVSSPVQVISFQVVFMAVTIFIVSKGIGKGIERFCKIFMPLLFVMLIILTIRSITLPGASEGLAFYLKPDFSKVTDKTVLAAMGQAFFSLSLGIGAMLVYCSYLGKQEPLLSSALQVGILDSLVAFIAGLVIFPAVFAFGFEPGSGPGLTFVTLPAVFAKMPGGSIFAALFFGLLAIASFTSSVNMLEIVCAYFLDEKGWKRNSSAWILGGGIFLLGIPSALSLTGSPTLFGKPFLDAMDFIASNVMMPIGGMGYALFAGWWIHRIAKEELKGADGRPFALFSVWSWLCRIVAPLAIGIIFVNGLHW